MVQTYSYREKRNAISAWLRDRFGSPDAIDPMFWRDAADLIKFLSANGWEIRLVDDD